MRIRKNNGEGSKGSKNPPRENILFFALLRVLRASAVNLIAEGYPLN